MTRDDPVAGEPLAQKLESLQDTIEILQDRVITLEREKDELREENQHLRNRVNALEETVETTVEIRHKKEIKRLNELVIGEDGLLTDEQEAFVEDEALIDHLRTTAAQQADLESLRNDLIAEQQTRSKHDSRIERRVALLADETDTDLSETTVAGEDKIQRLLKYGPDDITDTTYAWHYRARALLAHAGEIGSVVNDKFGKRITITGPDARTELKKIRDERLSSSQIRRIFEHIEQLAADSPRKVTAKTGNSNDENTLVVYLQQDEFDTEEGV